MAFSQIVYKIYIRAMFLSDFCLMLCLIFKIVLDFACIDMKAHGAVRQSS